MTGHPETKTQQDIEESGDDRYDAVIVGAGTAGLSAALVLGRSRRRVLVLDGGAPRNQPSSASHGFFTRDGSPPGELLRIGRDQLEPYPNVDYHAVRAAAARAENGAFVVTLESGTPISARKILLATGVVDQLPEQPGFSELWGKGVYHCPYCHGWEIRDLPLAVLAEDTDLLDRVVLIRNWSRDLVALTDGSPLKEASRDKVAALEVPVIEKPIARIEGRTDGKEGLSSIVFEDGSFVERKALFYGPPQGQSSDLAESLGCETISAGPFPVLEADPMTRETSVPGVYVAGDAGSPLQSLANAANSGSVAAAFVNHTLCIEDAEAVQSSDGNVNSAALLNARPAEVAAT